jgi:hypothetical protein
LKKKLLIKNFEKVLVFTLLSVRGYCTTLNEILYKDTFEWKWKYGPKTSALILLTDIYIGFSIATYTAVLSALPSNVIAQLQMKSNINTRWNRKKMRSEDLWVILTKELHPIRQTHDRFFCLNNFSKVSIE